jgi:lipopolysaccharide biosynthesis glycosyltransferase
MQILTVVIILCTLSVLLFYFWTTGNEATTVEIVHVALAADFTQWQAMLTAINSTLANCVDKKRLRFTVLCTPDERRQLEQYCHFALPLVAAGQLQFVEFDGDRITAQFARQSLSSSSSRNLSAPHNYVRFFMPQLLLNTTKVIWVDNDVLVLQDIALLYDMTLLSDQHALASVVVRRPYSASILRNLDNGLEVRAMCTARGITAPQLQGRPFGKAENGAKRQRSLVRTHAKREVDQLLSRARECRTTRINCFHFNAGVAVYRLDLWRVKLACAAILGDANIDT